MTERFNEKDFTLINKGDIVARLARIEDFIENKNLENNKMFTAVIQYIDLYEETGEIVDEEQYDEVPIIADCRRSAFIFSEHLIGTYMQDGETTIEIKKGITII